MARLIDLYVDPSAAGSSNSGTYSNPWTTASAINTYLNANAMAGYRLNFKMGTKLRGGLAATVSGAAGSPFIVTQYGDGPVMPIITGLTVITSWSLYGSGVYSYHIGTGYNEEVYQDGQRFRKYATLAEMQAAGAGSSYYDSTAQTMYIIPFDSLDPNLGQMEITANAIPNAISLSVKDGVGSGYITVCGVEGSGARSSGIAILAGGNANAPADLIVSGCRAGRAGAQGVTSGIAADGVIIYGASDSLRGTGCVSSYNYSFDCLNNANEASGITGFLCEHNTSYNCLGNMWLEAWASMTGTIVRYNNGLVDYADPSNQWLGTFGHLGCFWGTEYDFTGANNATANGAHEVYGNLGVGATMQGIEIRTGTGNKVYRNTIVGSVGGGNRLLNFGTNSHIAASIGVDCSENILYYPNNNGNSFLADIIQGTANNDQGVSMTGTITGDKNVYFTAIEGYPTMGVNAANKFSMSTYQTAAAPFDANSVFADPLLDANYRPGAGSPALGFGTTIATCPVDIDGVRTTYTTTPDAGCYQTVIASPPQAAA